MIVFEDPSEKNPEPRFYKTNGIVKFKVGEFDIELTAWKDDYSTDSPLFYEVGQNKLLVVDQVIGMNRDWISWIFVAIDNLYQPTKHDYYFQHDKVMVMSLGVCLGYINRSDKEIYVNGKRKEVFMFEPRIALLQR